ncbi:DUF4124 domain-containing protein, partial [bacterium]|nr:DUF4124 domain-containing protein [bacterium]
TRARSTARAFFWLQIWQTSKIRGKLHQHGAKGVISMMTKSMRLNVLVPLIGIISLVGMPAMSADIYKSVDKNGVVTFSDTPPKQKSTSDERIELPAHTNRMPSIKVPERQRNENNKAPVNASILAITAPLDNATIPMGPGIFDVLADIQPPVLGRYAWRSPPRKHPSGHSPT